MDERKKDIATDIRKLFGKYYDNLMTPHEIDDSYQKLMKLD